jgi:hypothetical protein
MTTIQHTPGPWPQAKLNNGYSTNVLEGHYRIDLPNGGTIIVTENKPGNQESNARLIAASPDLLEALIIALPYVETAVLDESYKQDSVKKVVEQIQQAINKATNERP